MADTSPPQLEEEDVQTQNPKSTQQEEIQPQQSHSPRIKVLEVSDPGNAEESEVEKPEIPSESLPQPQPQPQPQPEEGSQVPCREDERYDHQKPDGHQEQSGMSLSPPVSVTHVSFSDFNPPSLASPSNPPRRPNKRKKCNIKKQQAMEKKLQTLSENLKPVPFVPPKTLDFPKHEKLLRRLGLWDFVQIEFDRNIRVDLIMQLIANYDPKLRCSYVNDFRVAVNRADLARAFSLPVKKEKGNFASSSEPVDLDSEVFSEESISFLEDFVSNWVLLHEDMWIMPSEVLNWTRTIKDGHPEKVDWAGLIWFMVEKELMQGPQLVDCYYASHLQHLIKSQREKVFGEEPKVEDEVEVKEEEGDGDVKMGVLDNIREQDSVVLEEHNIELTLGQDIGEKEEIKDEDMMDAEEGKEEEHGQQLSDGDTNVGEHFLQRCSLEEVRGFDSPMEGKQEDEDEEEQVEEEDGEEEEEEEEEDGFDLMPNGDVLEGDGLTGNLLQGMEMNQISFSSLRDQAAVELLASASRDEPHTISGGPSIFGSTNKREIGHEHDTSHHSLNGSSKRLRTDGLWDNKSSDFGMCMEQMQQWMGRAKMMYEAKEHAYEESNMNQQILINELQRRDSVIEHLHKVKLDELQKKETEKMRLERELYLMGNLLEGYRKALKETYKAFSEYRQRNQLPEDPLYKDAGPGGVVLSTMELEKQRLKLEEEDRLNRLMIEGKITDFEEECTCKLQEHFNEVNILDKRLADIEDKVKLIKELSAKHKVSGIKGCAPDE